MPCRDAAVSAEWIDSDAGLREAAAEWRGCAVIGIDTEFQRTDTYFPRPGLYQVAAGARTYLLDPLSITDWRPLVEHLLDTSVTKVMHACMEDLELISHHLEVVPRNVFDTQLANAFQSADYSASYVTLVQQALGVRLEQHSTRSDWLKRPLSDRQLQYACEDVTYLSALHDKLANGLHGLGRKRWFADVMTERASYARIEPDEYYRSVKKAWRLDPRQLGRLRGLCAWRERQAMSENVPRNRVVWDEHLLRFACEDRLTEHQLVDVLPRTVARKYAVAIVEAHAELVTGGASADPLARPLTQAQSQVSKRLREIARRRAEGLNLAQELIARKREVDECIRHYLDTGELSAAYRGWRHGLVGGEFRAVLAEHL